ncbi:MAG: ChrR family anti-sigma-E factor [Hyphomicrobiales bacterium]
MTILHHLDEATILACAAGTLDEPARVLATTHMAMCPKCREAFKRANQIGAALLESETSEDISEDVLDEVMARIDSEEISPQIARLKTPIIDVYSADVPRPLARYVKWRLDDVPWKTIAPGIGTCDLDVSEGSPGKLKLIKLAPGNKVPEHGHQASEMTLVLTGTFSDNFGEFRPGDVAELGADEEHAPMTGGDEECICLIATEGRMQFKGLISRMLQPLTGM